MAAGAETPAAASRDVFACRDRRRGEPATADAPRMSTSPRPRIGFIGFGEVAAVFSAALVERGAEVSAYDVLSERPEGREMLRTRDRSGRVRWGSLAQTAASSDCLLSTVTTSVAVAAARTVAPHLRRGQTYVDLNATAPAVKREIAGIVAATGTDFVEGAILGAIGVSGAKTKILLGGERAEEVAGRLTQAGLNTVFYSREIGRASAFKLLRSVFSKGMEALLIEYLVAGERAGIRDDLWREIVDLFTANSFEQVANNWITTHATAHERRYHEVVQVGAELRALGVEPVITAATEQFFKRSGELGLKQAFGANKPTAADVVGFIAQRAGPAPASNP